MNTQLKVGDRVRVISGCNVCHNEYNGQEGEIIEIESKDSIMVKFNSDGCRIWVYDNDMGGKFNVELLSECIAHPIFIQPTPLTPTWRPIDKDNLPQKLVASINRNEDNPQVYTGSLHLNDANNMLYIQSIGGYVRLYDFTHYIPLSDLLNLPISE